MNDPTTESYLFSLSNLIFDRNLVLLSLSNGDISMQVYDWLTAFIVNLRKSMPEMSFMLISISMGFTPLGVHRS